MGEIFCLPLHIDGLVSNVYVTEYECVYLCEVCVNIIGWWYGQLSGSLLSQTDRLAGRNDALHAVSLAWWIDCKGKILILSVVDQLPAFLQNTWGTLQMHSLVNTWECPDTLLTTVSGLTIPWHSGTSAGKCSLFLWARLSLWQCGELSWPGWLSYWLVGEDLNFSTL